VAAAGIVCVCVYVCVFGEKPDTRLPLPIQSTFGSLPSPASSGHGVCSSRESILPHCYYTQFSCLVDVRASHNAHSKANAEREREREENKNIFHPSLADMFKEMRYARNLLFMSLVIFIDIL